MRLRTHGHWADMNRATSTRKGKELRLRSRYVMLVGAAAIGIGLGGPGMAQEGTPQSGDQPSASCEAIEPRNAEFFANLADSPQATPAEEAQEQGLNGAVATPITAELPEGEAADEAAVAEVSALYETLIDCLNRGDYLRAYALYSDEYLLSNLSEDVLNSLEATPVPAEESTQSEFGGVLEARVLDDGRIAALVTTGNPLSGEVLIRSTLSREEEGLRIADEVVVEAATPASPEG